jgi:hypothetical protein
MKELLVTEIDGYSRFRGSKPAKTLLPYREPIFLLTTIPDTQLEGSTVCRRSVSTTSSYGAMSRHERLSYVINVIDHALEICDMNDGTGSSEPQSHRKTPRHT